MFEVCVLGHLREVKDPFRAAEAARLLPPESQIEVVQVGGALEKGSAARAKAEMAANSRYRWLGEYPRWRAVRILARSSLLVLSSIMEGGANAVSEALACRVPVLSSRISGSIGLLGKDYPGYFRVGDTQGLARLLRRVETDSDFYKRLKRHCRRLVSIVNPADEKRRWEKLLKELG